MTPWTRPVRLAPLDLLGLGLLGLRTRKVRAALSALGTNILQAVPAQLPGGSVGSFPAQSVAMAARIAPVLGRARWPRTRTPRCTVLPPSTPPTPPA
jgi:putative ABC transport system permease protein